MICKHSFIASDGARFNDMEECNNYEKENLGGGVFCYNLDGEELPLKEVYDANVIVAKSSFDFWKDFCPVARNMTEEEASSLSGEPGIYIWSIGEGIYRYYSLYEAEYFANMLKIISKHLS